MKEFNVNSYVNIKITEKGIAILKDQHGALLERYADYPEALEKLGEFKAPEVDENGYTQMKMWEVMHAFGHFMSNENPNPPFEMDIAISELDLKDLENERGL